MAIIIALARLISSFVEAIESYVSNNSLLIERKVHLKLNNKNYNINVCIESDDSYI